MKRRSFIEGMTQRDPGRPYWKFDRYDWAFIAIYVFLIGIAVVAGLLLARGK